MPDIQRRQQEQYVFPYHHISSVDERGEGTRVRILNWGFEYLLYNARLVELVHSLRPQSILDVGCGDGYFLGQVDERIPLRVGVDINERALNFAKAFYPSVDYRNSDIVDVDEQFDVVSAIEVLEHIPEEALPAFLRAMSDRLAPGGSVLISVPTVNEPLNSKHFRHYDLNLLEKQVTGAVPDLKLVHSEFFYKKTWAETVYRRLTSGRLLRGEIPALRRFVWRHARKSARLATPEDGLHLIARFTKEK